MHHRKTISFLVLATFTCVSTIFFYTSMPYGIGIWHDSFVYLNSAENLLNGYGLSALDAKGELTPLIHFPPLYPLVLSGLSWITHWPVTVSASVIASLAYGFTIFLIGLFVLRYTNDLLRTALFCSLAVASPFISNIFRLAMTETIFLPTMLVFLFFFEQFLSNQKKFTLVFCAVITVFAWLTRYAGVFLLVTSILGIFFLQTNSLRKRAINLAIYGGIVGGFYGLWVLRNFLIGGPPTGRTIYFHPVRTENIRSAAATLFSWLSLVDASLFVRLGISAFIFVILAWIIFSKGFKVRCAQLVSKVLMIAIGSYAMVLFVSLTFFDASTRLDNRILSPFYILLLLLVSVLLPNRSEWARKKPISSGMLAILAFGFIALNGYNSWLAGREVFTNGLGYESPRWENSPTIEALGYLQPPGPIYSNHSYAINLWSPFTSRWLPETRDWVNDQPIDDYEAQFDMMQDTILDKKGILVLFTPEEKWVFVLMGDRLGDPLFCGDGYIYPGSNVIEPLPPEIISICQYGQPY